MKTDKNSCIFCSKSIKDDIIAKKGGVFAIYDRYPVAKHHCLIITKRHIPDYLSMSDIEKREANELISLLCNKIRKLDKKVSGFNIGMNCGQDAGQTIMHAHIHLIPRRKGDLRKPSGGIRAIFPSKSRY